MTVEVAVVGSPFLDLTFEGLARVPQPGEELVARRLHIAPGGSGMQAIGAARLGLSAALVAPLGSDASAEIMRDFMHREGVELWGNDRERRGGVPVSALLSTSDGVAMATGLGGAEPTAKDVAREPCSAAILSLGRLHLAPQEARAYAVTGSIEVSSMKDVLPEGLRRAHAFILNAAEATAFTGEENPEDAGRRLSELVPSVVVTMGANGAIALDADHAVRVDAPAVEVLDATGAGDLFVAAFVWADLRGSTLAEAARWACLYAALSVTAPTAFAGAMRLAELLRAGSAHGLARPPNLHEPPQ